MYLISVAICTYIEDFNIYTSISISICKKCLYLYIYSHGFNMENDDTP